MAPRSAKRGTKKTNTTANTRDAKSSAQQRQQQQQQQQQQQRQNKTSGSDELRRAAVVSPTAHRGGRSGQPHGRDDDATTTVAISATAKRCGEFRGSRRTDVVGVTTQMKSYGNNAMGGRSFSGGQRRVHPFGTSFTRNKRWSGAFMANSSNSCKRCSRRCRTAGI